MTVAVACRTVEVIIVATPVTAAVDIMEKIFALGMLAIVFDILSTTSLVIPVLRKMAVSGMRICLMHSMFGQPGTVVTERYRVVTDCGNPSVIEETAILFSGCTTLQMPIKNHDPIAVYVLGQSHAANLAFFAELISSSFSVATSSAAASGTFQMQIAISPAGSPGKTQSCTMRSRWKIRTVMQW
ncbi:MAG: hypothetical protein LBU24_06225 [Methanocalculaceae archaeon]|jgi:chorismate mutase/prephenate dehydrogenase|nr:hypothetical protein [Methanocalculaceae archaeon]